MNEQEANKISQSFIKFLKEEKCIDLLPEIILQLQKEKEAEESVTFDLITDVPYDDQAIEQIYLLCQEKTGKKKIFLNPIIDQNLGGGFVLRGREFLLDARYKKILDMITQ